SKYTETTDIAASLPISRSKADYEESPDEDSYLSHSLFSAQIDHLPLDVLPAPRQQRHENNERNCSNEEYFCEITRIVAEGQEQAHLISDQPCSETEYYCQIAAHPLVAESNTEPPG